MFSDFQDYHPKVTVGYEDFRRRVYNKNIWFAAHNTLTYETCMRFELLITTWRVRYTDCNENIRRGLVLVGPIMMRTKRKTRPKEQWLAESDYASWNGRSENTCFYKLPCNFPRNIFVPLEDQYKKTFPKQTRAVLWNEAKAVAGRSAADVTSVFVNGIRDLAEDAPNIVIWLDNCSAHNKNWFLYTTIARLLNNEETEPAVSSVTLKYLEPGHTFLSYDSFHGHVDNTIRILF